MATRADRQNRLGPVRPSPISATDSVLAMAIALACAPVAMAQNTAAATTQQPVAVSPSATTQQQQPVTVAPNATTQHDSAQADSVQSDSAQSDFAQADPDSAQDTAQAQPARASDVTASADQTAATDAVKSLDTVSVSASRIDLAGFVAPTPTTVVGETQLRQGARNNVAGSLNDLPAFRPADSPVTSPGSTENGQTNLNFRGLGSARTLVLLNRRRFVGNADLNSVPFALVKSVDVVTGGASAAWGSDAVAGVVNIALDDRLEGTKLEARTGLSAQDDGLEYMLSAATGTRFADGRGHFIIGAEFLDNEGIYPRTARARAGRWGVVTNPDYTPSNGQGQYVIAQDLGWSNASLGGLIVDGVLAGQTFNPDGSLRPFRFGRISGTNMVGGEGSHYDDFYSLSVPQKRYNLLSRVGYDLNDQVRFSADVRYSRMYNRYKWMPNALRGDQSIAISIDNAFLPQAVRDAMLAAGETAFRMGRVNHDFAWLEMKYERENVQTTAALEGMFGDYWRWDAYLSYGKSTNNIRQYNQPLRREFLESVDSVRHPVTGRPVCRVAITNPSSDCVPINLFGAGNVSDAARDYVVDDVYRWDEETLLTGGASLRGEPFELPAGPVSIATGIEARREEFGRTVDPRTDAEEFMTWNPQGWKGSYNVKEGFLEAVVPLVKDAPLLQDLSFNGAARLSDYSSSGAIWTYKLGITNKITPSLLLRATKSRDIRSANLGEMYTSGGIWFTHVVDPVTGVNVDFQVNGDGNLDLVPETSDTRTVGLVFTPESIPDLSVSLDYFDIVIDDIITTIDAQQIVNRCYDGNATLCDLITRDPETNIIIRMRSPFINLAKYETNGADLDAAYGFALEKLAPTLPGELRLRGMLTYVDQLITDDGINRINSVGSLFDGVSRIRANLGATYHNNGFSLDLRARYIHSGDAVRTLDLQNNAVPSFTSYDLGVQYTLTSTDKSRFSVYANASNLFDKAPPQGMPMILDLIGRYYNIGARLEF